jgi:iron only hydrogenase large subunit-like protein
MAEFLTLKPSNCKNCHKCIRHCPVKSIRFENNQAHIVGEECVLCGRCFVACPQNAKEIRDDRKAVQAMIAEGAPVYASLAPSFTANYGGLDIAAMERALRRLGFAGAEETALGAAIIKRRYDAMLLEERQDVIISSCCHSVNLLIQKYYPAALPLLAPALSPMLAHGMDIKRRHPGAKIVFIGPCIAKKDEAETYAGPVDGTLTFRELSLWLEQENISLDKERQTRAKTAAPQRPGQGLTRIFPAAGGILRSMARENPRYAYFSVDGIDNCVRLLENLVREKPEKCFIEMSACAGSCLGGPVMERRERSPALDYIAVLRQAGEEDFATESYSAEELDKQFAPRPRRQIYLRTEAIEETLRKLGKTKPEHELNCGSCGYNTCREKAQAALEGKATLTMCLPYLKKRAESFSDTIIANTPNGIIVLNENLEVQQINAAACRIFNIRAQDILGDRAVSVLDPAPFVEARRNRKNTYNRTVYLADYEKYIDQTIIYDESRRIVIGILRDITDDTARRTEKEALNRKTIEIADKVIGKQMRVVHEIASLLGETTAETRVALTKLKEGLLNA